MDLIAIAYASDDDEPETPPQLDVVTSVTNTKPDLSSYLPSKDHKLTVVAVRKNDFTYSMLDLKLFETIGEKIRGKRGDCKEEFGYYGSSAKKLQEIFKFGFHGTGSIVLSKEEFLFDSILNTEKDHRGIRHIIKVKVLVGNICDSSSSLLNHTCPPDDNVDIGVTSRSYHVFDCYKNSIVLPIELISFQLDPALENILSCNHNDIPELA